MSLKRQFQFLPRTYQIQRVSMATLIPSSLSIRYAHPLEHFISNMLSIAAGPVLLQVPMSTTWIYVALANTVTLIDHSGFKFPFLQDTISHDLHHEKSIFNYGGVGWIDFIHNTLQHESEDKIKSK